MDKRKRYEQLLTELQRMEQRFVAHNQVPGHPDFCVQQAVQIKVWDCLLGSPESPANVWVDWTASLDRKKVLKALRMAAKRMEYDSKLDEFLRLRDEGCGDSVLGGVQHGHSVLEEQEVALPSR